MFRATETRSHSSRRGRRRAPKKSVAETVTMVLHAAIKVVKNLGSGE
jgi:hypothetical protein